MSPLILNGRTTREALLPAFILKVKKLPFRPVLAIVQVGDRKDSSAFIKGKKSFAAKVGIDVKHIQLAESATEQEVFDVVRECNADPLVNGVIVQLPLPEHIDKEKAINAVDPRKDVDAISAASVEKWSSGKSGALIPATARGIRELLEHNSISLQGKKVCVVGRSALVGTPIAVMCRNEGATVTVCNKKTPDLAAETKLSDILIVAAGKAGLISSEHVSKGQVIVDVGINAVAEDKLEDEAKGKKLVGDVDFDKVKDIVSAISPVPGGVGPMTVFALFENLADLCENG